VIENALSVLKALIVDRWYIMLLIVSVFFLFIGLTMPVQVIPNAALVAISFGGFLAGLGEVINHPRRLYVGMMFDRLATVKTRERRAHRGGIALVVAGIAFALLGVALIVRAAL